MFVITGGGSGIGRALAHALARREKPVLILGRRKHLLAETAQFSPLIDFLSIDVTTQQGREQIVSKLHDVDSLDGLVHNAGIIEPMVDLAEIEEAAWQKVMATNLNAPLFLTQALLNKLLTGRVLHIGSGAAYFPVASWSAYCVSKAASAMLTRCWQLEHPSPFFASVMPGIIDTEMQATIRRSRNMAEEKLQYFQTLFQEDRLLKPETVALFLVWLLIDIAAEQFITKEWDIYDKSHHKFWLNSPHKVPTWE